MMQRAWHDEVSLLKRWRPQPVRETSSQTITTFDPAGTPADHTSRNCFQLHREEHLGAVVANTKKDLDIRRCGAGDGSPSAVVAVSLASRPPTRPCNPSAH